jgi:phosphoenolpyruvate carboxykinase (GTP)
MADYFGHWLRIGEATDPAKLPRIFAVNWFRRDADGRFLWPGFGENSRVLEWVFRRCDEDGAGDDAVETPIGWVPAPGALDLAGLDLPAAAVTELLRVDHAEWRAEAEAIATHFAQFGDNLPPVLAEQLAALRAGLAAE